MYGALNRLEEAADQAGKAAKYQYNGLGHRVGKLEGSLPAARMEQMEKHLNPQSRIDLEIGNQRQISYTIDLTREYHNLLERSEGDSTQTYFWDGNVASYEENGQRSFYLQDELGSPLRIEDETGRTRESYGYGAFGEDLYGNQGELQPFGYTGYQKDRVAGTYYAQAREYQADKGRFAGEDKLTGITIHPITFNRYIYCINIPLNKTDKTAFWFGIDDLIAAGAGAFAGFVSQAAGDIVTTIVTGEIHISSWQDYTGSIIGGAAGGVTTLYAGPVIGAVVSGGLSTLSSEGLKAITEPDYNRSLGSVLMEAGGDAFINGVFSFGFNKLKFKGDPKTDAFAKMKV